jgi:hypothetical protein
MPSKSFDELYERKHRDKIIGPLMDEAGRSLDAAVALSAARTDEGLT